jgi:uncharacterized membrane protein (DUF106 family)
MTKLLTFDNFVKAVFFASMITGIYYGIKQDNALIIRELAYIRDRIDEKEFEARAELAELKQIDNEQAKRLAELKESIIRIYAVLPKRIELTDEQDNRNSN